MKHAFLLTSGIAGLFLFTALPLTGVLAQPAAAPSAEVGGGTSLDQPSDTQVERTIKQDLAKDPATRNANINVAIRDHMVILTGDVKSRAVASRALDLVSHVNGVKGVENLLRYGNGGQNEARSR